MLRFDLPRCPQCGEPPAGTLETVPGLAELVEAGDGLFEYGGYTRIGWNGQKSVTRHGQLLLECPAGHRWWSGRQDAPVNNSPQERIP